MTLLVKKSGVPPEHAEICASIVQHAVTTPYQNCINLDQFYSADVKSACGPLARRFGHPDLQLEDADASLKTLIGSSSVTLLILPNIREAIVLSIGMTAGPVLPSYCRQPRRRSGRYLVFLPGRGRLGVTCSPVCS